MRKQRKLSIQNRVPKIAYKREWKKGVTSLLVASMIFTSYPAVGHAAEYSTYHTENFEVSNISETDMNQLETYQVPNTKAVTINSYASTYGRNWLEQYYKDNNHKKEEVKKLYDTISSYIKDFQESSDDAELNRNYYYFNKKLDVNSIGKNFSIKELEMIYTVVLYDHPEFYVTQGIFYTTDYLGKIENMVVNCTADYAKGSIRTALNKEIEDNIQRYLEEVSGLKTNLEKETAVHNKLLKELTYAYENNQPSNQPYAHNIVSVFDNNQNTMPVCEGYAKAFQLLLNACGIENLLTVGTLDGVAHAWNIVNLDGSYYYVDVTQDDSRYDIIERNYKGSVRPSSYTPHDVAKWAENTNLAWSTGERCTIDNILYYYFNKNKDAFKDYKVSNVFNLNGNNITQEQYNLPAIADRNYSNTTQNTASYSVTYDKFNSGELTVYNNGIEVKSKTKVSEGTVLTVKFKPLENSKVYSIYEGTNLIQTTRQDTEYTGSFVLGSRDTTITIQAREPEVTGVSLNNTSLSFSKIGDTVQLIASVIPSTAKNQRVSWNSSNPSVVTVDENGFIKTIANGKAIITVTTEEGAKTATCEITVDTTKPTTPVAVQAVEVNNSIVNLFKIGDTSQLTAIIIPSNASNQRVSWSSDNTRVATVDNNGKVTAVSNGTAHITVTTEDGKKKAVSTITVDTKSTSIPVTSIHLDRTQIEISSISITDRLTPTLTPSNATNQNIIWTSSNPTVATVNGIGEITSVSNGTTIITAATEDGQKTANCTIIVNTVNSPSEVRATGITLNKTETTLSRSGSTEVLKATVYPTNATNTKVRWKSDKTTIATVDSNGMITAVRTGTANITATTEDGKFVATCVVTVKNASNSSSSRPDSNNSNNNGPGSNNSSNNNQVVVPTSKNVWESDAAGWKYRDAAGQYIKNSWAEINGKWYYFGTNTYMQKGWLLDKTGKWYYLDTTNGEMKTGWQKVNNQWYYLDTQNGQMKTGWQKVNNIWYFMDRKSGEMKTGWVWVDNKWYYLNREGAMLTGWQKINNKWYFMDKGSGEMKTGWVWVDNKWYYLNREGAMLTGWQRINNNWYYLTTSGECLMNTTTPDGKKVDKNGVWIP